MVLQTILKLYFIVHAVKLPFIKVRFVMLLCSVLWTIFRPHFVRSNIHFCKFVLLAYQYMHVCTLYVNDKLSYIGHLSLRLWQEKRT